MARTRIREKLCFCESPFSCTWYIPNSGSHDVHHRTLFKLDVWHKSQSKTKSRRRRHHVASAVMPLGEVMRNQGTDPCKLHHVLHVPCSCRLYWSARRGTSFVRRSCCTKKVYGATAAPLCFSPCSPATTAIGHAGRRLLGG